MTSKNTMSKAEFAFKNIFWSIMMHLFFRHTLFTPLMGISEKTSVRFLLVLQVALIIHGFVITYEENRNHVNLILNILFPFEAYILGSYWFVFNTWAKVTLFMIVLLSALFALLNLFRRFPKYAFNRIEILFARLDRIYSGTRIIAILCLCAFLIPVGARTVFATDLYQAKQEETVVQEKPDQWSLANNMETVAKLKAEVWHTLSIQEKLDTLAAIKNIEARYLGFPYEIELTADILEENVMGCYKTGENKIVIDLFHLAFSNPDKVLRTLTHECHHAYSFQQVKLYSILPQEYKNMLMFERTQDYEKEYANYVGGGDYDSYATQACEVDANTYADQAVQKYFAAIITYENKGEKQ